MKMSETLREETRFDFYNADVNHATVIVSVEPEPIVECDPREQANENSLLARIFGGSCVPWKRKLPKGFNLESQPKRFKEDPAPRPATQISDLNDDCIEAIFKNLSIQDMANMLDVMPQYEPIAQSLFRRKHQCCLNFNKDTDSISSIERVLKYFGPQTVNLTISARGINGECNGMEIISMLCDYVTDKLVSLTFIGFIVNLVFETDTAAIQILMMFVHLSEFRFLDGFMTGGAILLDIMKLKIEILDLRRSQFDLSTWQTIQQTFPKLREIYMNNWRVYELCNLIRLNPTIEVLHLTKQDSDMELLMNIARLPNLQQLTIRFGFLVVTPAFRVSCLSRLKNLTSLSLRYNYGHVTPIISALTKCDRLRALTLREATVDNDFFLLLAQIKGLSTLKLNRVHGITHLPLNDITNLRELKELYLRWGSLATNETLFSELVQMPKLRLMNIQIKMGNNSTLTEEHIRTAIAGRVCQSKLMVLWANNRTNIFKASVTNSAVIIHESDGRPEGSMAFDVSSFDKDTDFESTFQRVENVGRKFKSFFIIDDDDEIFEN